MDNALININGNGVPTLEILVMMTVVMMLPSLVIMMTSFTRTIIILSFTRNALGIQQTPPNMVLVGYLESVHPEQRWRIYGTRTG